MHDSVCLGGIIVLFFILFCQFYRVLTILLDFKDVWVVKAPMHINLFISE